jgi:hypothetical protein
MTDFQKAISRADAGYDVETQVALPVSRRAEEQLQVGDATDDESRTIVATRDLSVAVALLIDIAASLRIVTSVLGADDTGLAGDSDKFTNEGFGALEGLEGLLGLGSLIEAIGESAWDQLAQEVAEQEAEEAALAEAGC